MYMRSTVFETAKYAYVCDIKKSNREISHRPFLLQIYQLTDLPPEILIIIISFLKVKCVLNMGQTCQHLNNIVNKNIVWCNLYRKDFSRMFSTQNNYYHSLNTNKWKAEYKAAYLQLDSVIILNNLTYCNEYANKIKKHFLAMGYRIIFLCNKNFSIVELETEICKREISQVTSLVIFFFGYGFNENIYIGRNYFIKYSKFCEIFTGVVIL